MAERDVLVELYYNGAWQDITSDVLAQEGITLGRGLSEETLEWVPGRMKLSTLNEGGKYNPQNPTSPLYGLVGRNTPIRVSEGGDVLQVGEVAVYAPSRPVRATSRCAITGAGVLRRLGRGQTPLRSVAYRSFITDEYESVRIGYWPLEEASGSNAAELFTPFPGAGVRGIPIHTVNYGAYDGHPAAERMLVMGEDARLDFYVPAYSSTETKVMNLWMIPSDLTPTGERQLYRMYVSGGSFDYVDFVYNNSVGHQMGLNAWSGGSIVNSSAFSLGSDLFDAPILLALEFSPTGGNLLARIVFYTLGGISLGDATWTGKTLGNVTRVTVGDRRISDVRDLEGVAVGHFSVSSDVDAFRNFVPISPPYGFRAFLGETAAARAQRLADEEGVPLVVVGTAATSEPMGFQRPDTLTELLLECARTDSALLYEARDGTNLQFRCGRHLYVRDPALTMTLSMTADGVSPGMEPEVGDLYVRNDVEAKSQTGSGRAVLTSGPMSVQAPPDGVGRYDTTWEVNPEDDGRLAHHAGWHLSKGTVQEIRYRKVTVDLDANPALTAAINDRGVGHVLVLTDLDPDDSPDDVRGLIVYVENTIRSHRRLVTFTLVPASPYDVAIIGEDAGTTDLLGFRIDTDLTVLNEALDTTETGVDTTGGTWTTDADNWNTGLSGGGLFLTIGGEVMRVTNRSGSTFTVVRSVNGVVKTHASGTPVHVTYPAKIGL